MVNNAGIAPDVPPFLEMSDDDFARTIDANLDCLLTDRISEGSADMPTVMAIADVP